MDNNVTTTTSTSVRIFDMYRPPSFPSTGSARLGCLSWDFLSPTEERIMPPTRKPEMTIGAACLALDRYDHLIRHLKQIVVDEEPGGVARPVITRTGS